MDPHRFHQDLKKKKNQKKIIDAISSIGKTNKELQTELKLSHTTLGKHLRELETRNEIKKDVVNGNVVYVLSDKGILNPAKITILSTYLQQINKRKGLALYDYSRLWIEMMASSLPWGIHSHLVMDKDLKEITLLTRDDVREIEQLIFEKLAKNIKKDKLKRNVTNGNFEIGFNGNYKDLLESTKADSLKYYENMSTAEWNLLRKIDDEPEFVSNNDLKKLQELREKTYQKIDKTEN